MEKKMSHCLPATVASYPNKHILWTMKYTAAQESDWKHPVFTAGVTAPSLSFCMCDRQTQKERCVLCFTAAAASQACGVVDVTMDLRWCEAVCSF